MESHDITDYRLGETNQVLRLDSVEDNRALIEGLLAQAQRYVYIVSRNLDPLLYDTPSVADAISRLVREHSRAHVHILITHPELLVKRGHALVRLAQQLSSKIKLMQPSEERRNFNEALLIVDGVGYIHRDMADRMEGLGSFHDPFHARMAQETFDALWQRATPISDLRPMLI